jgi:hypothetical protein
MMCRWEVDPLDVEDTENSSSSPNTTDVGITFVPSATGYDTSLRTPLNIEWPDYLAVRPDFDQLVRYSLPWSRCRVARMSSGSGSAAVTIWSPAWISMVW